MSFVFFFCLLLGTMIQINETMLILLVMRKVSNKLHALNSIFFQIFHMGLCSLGVAICVGMSCQYC